jgi:hypothetical protein
MSISQSGNAAHDAASNASEATRQAADVAALATFRAGGTSAALARALQTNALADFRRRVASATSNGIDPGVWRQAVFEITGSYA